MKDSSIRKRSNSGHTLIEVLIGIMVFALGMMALASLQGSLARNSGDSNARTIAANIAEETIESVRTFSQVTPSNPPGSVAAFADIVDAASTVTVGAIDYTVTTDVTDYYYNYDAGSFSIDNTDSAAYADMKLVALTVTWNSAQEFNIDQTRQSTGMLGSGSITLTDIISSIPTASGGKIALSGQENTGYAPAVDYSPGENPDIISIQLGANKFKESTTPLPDIIRADELVETRFDVVTYSQVSQDATFLRREEFRAVSCECTLRTPSGDDEGGLRPTIWEGFEYTEAEFIEKPYGESANNQQSGLCSLCCRDHHDGGTSSNPETLDDSYDPGRSRYSPFRSSSDYHASGSLAGDHKHYNKSGQGDLTLAESDGDVYVEACRMVRKDGFFRIAQDLRQEGLNAFPADYLDEESEVEEYSGYVTTAVSAFEDSTYDGYELRSPPLALVEAADLNTLEGVDSPLVFPASTAAEDVRTTLPTAGGATSQQLRSRGIYIDYMSDVLRDRIVCLEAALAIGGTGADCDVPNVGSALEIIPFYDVQLTWLSRWNETPDNYPVDVTNEAIETNNEHDRGIAQQQNGGNGPSTINAAVHRGNLGLTGTDPIDRNYSSELTFYNLYAFAGEYVEPPVAGFYVSGNITSGVNGVRASEAEVEGTNAECNRTNTGYHCFVEEGTTNALIKVYNYDQGNKVLVACSSFLSPQGQEHVQQNGQGSWTKFSLPAGELGGADIVISENSCG